MSRAKKSEDQPWLKYVVLPLLLIFFGLFTSYLYLARTKTSQSTLPAVIIATPTPTPTPPKYTCPETPWVGCMPILDEEAARNCTPEALNWFTNNCPGFQGAAY